ncbi:SAM-dependent methyltransferase [Mycobacterium paraffinicum]|uniref:S-adenosyl-L-methionine-dependent methyltransferase n=1 Tax=Mycobacterium paraffinicum TaxID=53378 RepID=A0A1Q4HYB9_9MYCO|nr:SAM-dependent methyltransferase [Mycobacterium paraffinicum]OJZ74648.1 SAM-dependent methyltransferase [Mycobacterium paraffinicum]
MARTADDSWDIASGVGATAVMVALARAAETASANPLIQDPYAELLVSADELEHVRAQAAADWNGPASDSATTSNPNPTHRQNMINYQAVRTHFFDAYLLDASAAGIHQVVNLAAGLDSRAYRLQWAPATIIFEIDLPKVLEYKATTLARHGVSPTADLRPVAADLRHNWPQTLRDSGFDVSRPAVWLAEGLMPFLPAKAHSTMFTAIDQLSRAGSRAAVEIFGVDGEAKRPQNKLTSENTSASRQRHVSASGFDTSSLWFDDEGRPDCAEWFATHQWTTNITGARQEAVRLGRAPRTHRRPFTYRFVTATKSQQ